MPVATPTVRDDLLAVRQLIAHERNFVQDSYATDKFGVEVSPIAMVACRFCLVGAMHRVAKVALCAEVPLRLRYLINVLFLYVGDSLIAFNDKHTHAEVLALIDCALAGIPPEHPV